MIPGQTRSLWIDFLDTSAIVPGTYQIDILIYGKDEKEPYQILTVNLNVLDKVLSEQTLIHTEWFHADCLADYYHIPVYICAPTSTIDMNTATGAEIIAGWSTSWYVFAAYALIVSVLFAVFFRYKHIPQQEK